MNQKPKNELAPEDKPVTQGMMARAAGALRSAVNAGISSWFSALAPLPQAAPPSTPTRRWDFPTGSNIDYYPRAGETLGFGHLWDMADGYPLLRLVIETRKDQLAKMPWVIREKSSVAGRQSPARRQEQGKVHRSFAAKNAAQDDKSFSRSVSSATSASAACPERSERAVKRLTEFFEYPDGEHSFSDWLRPLAEDLLVGDCLTLEPVKTRGGDLVELREVSGRTIFPVIDARTGYTPAPPEIAYQQIIKGIIAAEFTADELIYRPRNRRTHKRYGYSPVEQVQLMVNTGLRYEMSRLAYFTSGTIPDAYLGVPPTWTSLQIKEAHEVLEANLAGNLWNRRKIFVGPDCDLKVLKPFELKTELDEWLARFICYAFSVSPQPFVREMNRATAESAKSAALEEGLHSLLGYFAELFNFVIRKYFGITDLEFAWQDEKAVDAKEQADLCVELVESGIITPDEARERLGMPPLPGGDALQPISTTEGKPEAQLS